MSNTTISLNRLRDYSSLFSRKEVLSWLNEDFSSIEIKINRHDKNWINTKNKTFLEYLRYLYKTLESNYQNEYIIKNLFLNEWLIKEIGESDSIIFNEFRVGKAIADLAMFNGVSKVFEIKTELDTDLRLSEQLNYYTKAFNQVYLIVPKSKLSLYDKYDKKIGLISYENNSFTQERESYNNIYIDNGVIMDILHTKEYKSICKSYYKELPEMTSFNQFNICGNLVQNIPSKALNSLFIDMMKSRTMTNSLSKRYYKEFNQLFLALKLNKLEKKKLINNLKTPIIKPNVLSVSKS